MGKLKSSHSDHWPQHIENVEEKGKSQANSDTKLCHTSTIIPTLNHGNIGKNDPEKCVTTLCHIPVPRRRQKKYPAGLWLRGTQWQFKKRVPPDLEAAVGRSFIRVSLKTSNYLDAVRMVRKLVTR